MKIKSDSLPIYPAGGHLVAIDTPVQTYLSYIVLSQPTTWNPNNDGYPMLAQWQNVTSFSALRLQPFVPGQVLSQGQIWYLLPATKPAATRISITDSPFNAPVAPADAASEIQAALNAAGLLASPGNPVDVTIPPGTFNHSTTLTVPAYVHLYGAGGVLVSTTPADSTINLLGDGSSCLFVTHQCTATARLGAFHATGIWSGPSGGGPPAAPVNGQMVVGCEVSQTAGAHILITNVNEGLVAFNYAHDGYSDAYHFQQISKYCQLVANRTQMHNSSIDFDRGDDMFAFVGLFTDGDPVHHCSCIANFGRNGPAHQITTSGAWFIDAEYNDTSVSNAAGVYNWEDSTFKTYGSANNIFRFNKIAFANIASSHAGILCGASDSGLSHPSNSFGIISNVCTNTTILQNEIDNTQLGIIHGQAIDVRASSKFGEVVLNFGHGNQPPFVSIGTGTDMIVAANNFT